MMNNNHKKSGCGFEEELVSYIYGEADPAANAKFERHLAACPICTDELEAFSGVHFAIGDWKASEFSALATPAIEIPYPPAAREVSDGKESWLSAFVRDLFSLSPRAISLAAASFAVLAVAFGAVLFIIKSNGGTDIAESNTTSKSKVAPTIEKTPEPANATQNNTPPVTPPEQKMPPEVVRQPETKADRAVKVADKPRPPQKAENTNTPKSNDPKRANKNNRIKTPELPDEDEDDTLRLAELFEEIDTRD